jgi:hypothetical protein
VRYGRRRKEEREAEAETGDRNKPGRQHKGRSRSRWCKGSRGDIRYKSKLLEHWAGDLNSKCGTVGFQLEHFVHPSLASVRNLECSYTIFAARCSAASMSMFAGPYKLQRRSCASHKSLSHAYSFRSLRPPPRPTHTCNPALLHTLHSTRTHGHHPHTLPSSVVKTLAPSQQTQQPPRAYTGSTDGGPTLPRTPLPPYKPVPSTRKENSISSIHRRPGLSG